MRLILVCGLVLSLTHAATAWSNDLCSRFGARLSKLIDDEGAKCEVLRLAQGHGVQLLSDKGIRLSLGLLGTEEADVVIALGAKRASAVGSEPKPVPELGKAGFVLTSGHWFANIGGHLGRCAATIRINTVSVAGRTSKIPANAAERGIPTLAEILQELSASDCN